MSNPYATYKRRSIETASQGRLVIMLFEGAANFMRTFVEAARKGSLEEAHNNSIKAQRIMTELMISLDLGRGEIAARIYAAYEDIRMRMIRSNLRKDTETAEGVIRDLELFKETWEEVFRRQEEMTPPKGPSGVSIRT